MSDPHQPSTNISLDLPFAEQDAVQALLGYPTIDTASTVASSELLYKFIGVTHQWLKENLEISEDLPGIKVGFERKVLVGSKKGQYRVESQFSSNSLWRSEYERNIIARNLVRFLVDPREEENTEQTEGSETGEQNPDTTNISYKLVDRISEEINRLYPKLKECIEIHVYVFWNIVSEKSPESTESTKSILSRTVAQSSCPCTDEDGNSKPNHRHRYKDGEIIARCAIADC